MVYGKGRFGTATVGKKTKTTDKSVGAVVGREGVRGLKYSP